MKGKLMKKKILHFVSFMCAMLILLGLINYQGNKKVSAAEIDLELGESGLSYKHEGTIGTPGEPYIFSSDHLNQPEGLFVDSSGALYIAEKLGMQVLKYNAAGDYERSFGVYGQPWHHDNYLYRLAKKHMIVVTTVN